MKIHFYHRALLVANSGTGFIMKLNQVIIMHDIIKPIQHVSLNIINYTSHTILHYDAILRQELQDNVTIQDAYNKST